MALSLTDDILAQFYERVFEASKTLDMKEEGVRLGRWSPAFEGQPA